MPASLDRCVQQVMDDPDFEPRDPDQSREQAAFAVCRASLGLSLQGDEDNKAPEMDDMEMKRRVKNYRASLDLVGQFTSGPTLHREFELARVGRNFKNGGEAFDLTRGDLEAMAQNFQKFRRLVPVYLVPDHPLPDSDYRSAGPSDGWVERAWIDGSVLKVALKVHGRAAIGLMNDEYRGVSMGAFRGRDLQGKPAGYMLDHVLITNIPFFSDLNSQIAATAHAAGSGGFLYLTSRAEAEMADPKKEEPSPAAAAAKDEVIALKAAVTDQGAQITALKSENDKLNLALKERAEKDVKRDRARQIRALVLKDRSNKDGLRVTPAELKGLEEKLLDPALAGETEDLALLKWFDESEQWQGNLHTLRFAVGRAVPIVSLNQTAASGKPEPPAALPESQLQAIRDRGHDPEIVAAMTTGATYADFLRLKAQKKAAAGGGKKE